MKLYKDKIKHSASGLQAIFTVVFSASVNYTLTARVIQQNTHDNTLGGIVSIA